MGEVERIMQFTELAPPGWKGFGLVRRAALILFWTCNDVASQSTKPKSIWAEALQSDAERLGVDMSGFQYHTAVWPDLGNTWGLNNNFDEGAARLYMSFAHSAVPHVNGDSMYAKAARPDLWGTRIAPGSTGLRTQAMLRWRFVSPSASVICAASRKRGVLAPGSLPGARDE